MGILIIMGIHQFLLVRYYWSTDPILGVPAVSSVMTRERFKIIMGKIHLHSNKTMLPKDDFTYDKLHKVELLVDDFDKIIKQAH